MDSKEKNLIVFDIDNGIGSVDAIIGTDQWFEYMKAKHISQGSTVEEAICLVLPAYTYIHFTTPFKLIEQETPEFIRSLQDNNYNVISLTSRSSFLAYCTTSQLSSIGISFAKNNLQEQIVLNTKPQCIYKDGIIFTGQNNKGDVLIKFIHLANLKPSKIIFIDDKLKNLQLVQAAIEKNFGIDFVGIRYSRCDEYVKEFDCEKADKEFQDIVLN